MTASIVAIGKREDGKSEALCLRLQKSSETLAATSFLISHVPALSIIKLGNLFCTRGDDGFIFVYSFRQVEVLASDVRLKPPDNCDRIYSQVLQTNRYYFLHFECKGESSTHSWAIIDIKALTAALEGRHIHRANCSFRNHCSLSFECLGKTSNGSSTLLPGILLEAVSFAPLNQ